MGDDYAPMILPALIAAMKEGISDDELTELAVKLCNERRRNVARQTTLSWYRRYKI